MERASAEKFYNSYPSFLESCYEIIAHKPFILLHFININSQRGPHLLAIDKILDAIYNGEWHEIKEITGKTKLKEAQIELISSFLAAYDFLELDRKSKRMRLSPQLQRFLAKIREIECDEVPRKGHASTPNTFS